MIYKLINNSDYIFKIQDGIQSVVPNDPANSDWQVYQLWLAADPSNQPLPADG